MTTKRKTNIKYDRIFPPRNHEQSSFRGLHMDDDNHATVASVLGLNHSLKVGTSEALCLLARVHTGANALD